MLDVVYGQATDVGRVRPHNEDAAGASSPASPHHSSSPGWLFAVADGVGGMDLGDVASTTAIQAVVAGFSRCTQDTDLTALLPDLIQQANSAVHVQGLHPARRGRHMAASIVLCALRDDRAVIAHVGDARCYHVRNSKVTQITTDHTWVAEQHRLGLITTAEAERSEGRHILTRSLGPELSVVADTTAISLESGDRLVLCTHGLYGGLYPEDIASRVSKNEDIAAVTQDLVNYAVEVDGSDNATAQIIQVHTVDPTQPQPD